MSDRVRSIASEELIENVEEWQITQPFALEAAQLRRIIDQLSAKRKVRLYRLDEGWKGQLGRQRDLRPRVDQIKLRNRVRAGALLRASRMKLVLTRQAGFRAHSANSNAMRNDGGEGRAGIIVGAGNGGDFLAFAKLEQRFEFAPWIRQFRGRRVTRDHRFEIVARIAMVACNGCSEMLETSKFPPIASSGADHQQSFISINEHKRKLSYQKAVVRSTIEQRLEDKSKSIDAFASGCAQEPYPGAIASVPVNLQRWGGSAKASRISPHQSAK